MTNVARCLSRFVWLALLCLLCGQADAQPFNVLTFRPWAGYAIPNGVWLTGDFNGDGKQDIVHAVAGTSYVHVWTSNGSGGFNVGTFSPWPGYAIPNGLWLTGDFNGDGKTDIVHAVAGTDYVHLWTSNGNGTFTVSTFRPWNGYAIPNGVWLTGDFNRDGRTDIFHAVAGADYAHVWLSNGNGGFTISTFRPWAGYAIPNGVWLTGDFDGDGRTDVFHAVAGADYAHVWLSDGAGGFRVGTFRPWAGYAIPNGVWLAADFNGDGRTDVFHAVAGADYAHIWTASGAGSFTVGTFRPWAGYAIPNGLWMTGDFDGDGRVDVLHAVAGASYANLWRSTGTAQFSVTSFSPWAGYAIPNGLWLPADITGDGKTDVVHAVQGADYVHPWISALPGPVAAAAQVVVEGIEVTQAIQDMGHSVALVANRSTRVRVYLGTNATSSLTVTGTLTVRNAATGATTTVNSTGTASVNPAQNGQLRTKRESLPASLNFSIPGGFTAVGARQFTLASVSNATTGAAVSCNNCNVATRAVSFVNASSLRVRVLGLRYTTGTPPATVTNAPAAADFTLLRSWLLRAYPVDQVLMTQATINSTNAWPFACGAANAQLAAVRATDIAGGTDARTHYFGLVSNGGGFMRGCSSGIPAAADPTTVASGPTGNPAGPGSIPVNATGDGDASFGDWYGGHEIAHTFGRQHPGFCNGNSASDPSFPYPNGQISTSDGASTGFDVGDAANAIATTVLPGASRFDIMTYCNQPQWLSAYSYQAIRSRLDVEDVAFPSSPGADAGRGAAGSAARRKKSSAASEAPCPCEASVAPSLGRPPMVLTAGRAPVRMGVIGSETPPEIPRPVMERPQIPEGGREPAVPAPALPMAVVAEVGAVLPSAAERLPNEPPPQVALKSGRFVHIVARLNLSRNTGKIVSVHPVGRALVPTVAQNDRATLQIVDKAGRIVREHRVWVRVDTDVPPDEDQTALIDVAIPDPGPAAAGVRLLLAGKEVDAIRISAHAPRVERTRIARSDRDAIVLEWIASDADGDALTYIVQMSADKGRTWQTLAIGLSESRLELTRDQVDLARGRPLLRVMANDGWYNSPPKEIAAGASKR